MILEDDEDRAEMLAIVALGLERFRAALFANCLMGNRYYFLVRTHQHNLWMGTARRSGAAQQYPTSGYLQIIYRQHRFAAR